MDNIDNQCYAKFNPPYIGYRPLRFNYGAQPPPGFCHPVRCCVAPEGGARARAKNRCTKNLKISFKMVWRKEVWGGRNGLGFPFAILRLWLFGIMYVAACYKIVRAETLALLEIGAQPVCEDGFVPCGQPFCAPREVKAVVKPKKTGSPGEMAQETSPKDMRPQAETEWAQAFWRAAHSKTVEAQRLAPEAAKPMAQPTKEELLRAGRGYADK